VAAKHCKVHRGNYVVTLCLYVLYLPFVDIVLCILLQVMVNWFAEFVAFVYTFDLWITALEHNTLSIGDHMPFVKTSVVVERFGAEH